MQSRFCLLKKIYCALQDRREHCLSKETFQQLLLETLVSNEDTPCREHLGDLYDSQEQNQHITDITTFEGSENVVRTDLTGHRCRQETLLMLSCVTLVVEAGHRSGHPGVVKNPGAGCSHAGLSSVQNAGGLGEDGHSESKRRLLHVNVTEDSLMDGLKEINILSVLLKLSHSRDRFIRYASSKAILAVVKCPLFNNARECFLEEVMSGVINSSQASVRISNMELLKRFMSNRHGQDLNTWCHQHLTSSHILKAEYVQTILRYKAPQSIDELNTFLTLLQKIVKFVNKFEQELKESHLESLLDSNQEHLLQFLVRSLQYINKPEGRIACKKTLDIFNTFLPYGSHLAERKVITSFYSEMSERLLSEVCPSALMSAPYVRQFVCFGGSHVEGTLAERQNGDLALLRKLILALLKSCAVIVRLTPQVPSRQQLVCTCLGSVSELMQKTFDAGDLQWLPLVFGDQDDAWVEVLLCLLDIYVNTSRLSPTLTLSHKVNPHPIFLEFMDSNDHMVLVDLLTSPETCFLLYFLRYLKCLVCEWNKFVTACHLRFCVSHDEPMDLELSGQTATRVSDHPEQEACNNVPVEHSQLIEERYKRLQKSVKTDHQDGRDGDCRSSDSSQISSGAMTSSHTQPFPTQSSNLQPFPTQSSNLQPFPTQSSNPQPSQTQSFTAQQLQARGQCSGLSYLAAYCDGDDDDDDNDGDDDIRSSATTLTDGLVLIPGTVPSAVQPSAMSCDLECVESVMSELIRVGLRIERLSSQDLFPYNPRPLLSLLEQCELLYDGMETDKHVQ